MAEKPNAGSAKTPGIGGPTPSQPQRPEIGISSGRRLSWRDISELAAAISLLELPQVIPNDAASTQILESNNEQPTTSSNIGSINEQAATSSNFASNNEQTGSALNVETSAIPENVFSEDEAAPILTAFPQTHLSDARGQTEPPPQPGCSGRSLSPTTRFLLDLRHGVIMSRNCGLLADHLSEMRFVLDLMRPYILYDRERLPDIHLALFQAERQLRDLAMSQILMGNSYDEMEQRLTRTLRELNMQSKKQSKKPSGPEK